MISKKLRNLGVVGVFLVLLSVNYQLDKYGIEKVIDTSTSWIMGAGIIIPLTYWLLKKGKL